MKKLGEDQFKKYRRSWDISPSLDKNSEYSSQTNPCKKLKIYLILSLKNTYERVVPYFIKILKNISRKTKILSCQPRKYD